MLIYIVNTLPWLLLPLLSKGPASPRPVRHLYQLGTSPLMREWSTQGAAGCVFPRVLKSQTGRRAEETKTLTSQEHLARAAHLWQRTPWNRLGMHSAHCWGHEQSTRVICRLLYEAMDTAKGSPAWDIPEGIQVLITENSWGFSV